MTSDSSNRRYMVDTTAVAIALAAAGGGIATILTRFVDSAVASGYAVSTVGDSVEFPQSYFLTSPVNQDAQKQRLFWLKSG